MTGSLDLSLTLLVLGAALVHATWNALLKTGGDRLVTMALFGIPLVAFGGALALFTKPPAPSSWVFLAASVIVHLFYFGALTQMYREGDLSLVYPISRGSAPLLLIAASALLAGESLRPWEIWGVLIVSAGILSLTLSGGIPGKRQRRAVAYALITGVLIACYTLADGLGVRLAGSTFGYIGWMFLCAGLPWLAFLGYLRLRRPERLHRGVVLPGLQAGALAMIGYGLVIWVLNLAPMAPIAALRETSVIFAALIGAWKLGEPFGGRRILAAALVALGVALLIVPPGP